MIAENPKPRPWVAVVCALFLLAGLVGCQEEQPAEPATDEDRAATEPAEQQPAEPAAEAEDAPADDLQVVDVSAREFAFEAPDEISAGLTTFRLNNQGEQDHFLLIYRLPEGITQDEVLSEAVPVYDRVMQMLQDGEIDPEGAMEYLGEQLPEWFSSVEFRGGPGLVAPGGVAETTVDLSEPGLYLMECYVKDANGMFHSSMGMQKQFTVTGPRGEAEPPESDFEVNLANAGIEAPDSLEAGDYTVQVNFADDPEGGFPFDVHLARLAEDTDTDALREWMNWMNVGGLMDPAPAEFVGGAENMAAGNTAYMEIELTPGRYAWLSEVGATEAMYREFTVE
ncbi:MAG: hypothetical protein ACOCSR_04300 [Wenzhouxiangella sp.]